MAIGGAVAKDDIIVCGAEKVVVIVLIVVVSGRDFFPRVVARGCVAEGGISEARNGPEFASVRLQEIEETANESCLFLGIVDEFAFRDVPHPLGR